MQEKPVLWKKLYIGLMLCLVALIGLFYWLMKAYS